MLAFAVKKKGFYFSFQELDSWFNPGTRKTVVIWVISLLPFRAAEGPEENRLKKQEEGGWEDSRKKEPSSSGNRLFWN